MKKQLTTIFLLAWACSFSQAQEEESTDQVFVNPAPHATSEISPVKGKRVKNIILMIGDGMGFNQVQAGYYANKGALNLENAQVLGFSKTSSSDEVTTDSAAGATAFSCGIKTYNGAIGVTPDKQPVPTILEIAEQKGLKTGLVATCRITHATPASFIAHQPLRSMYQEIALDFLTTPVDVFIGGGRENFTNRRDGRNLLTDLKKSGYTVITSIDSIPNAPGDKLAGLIHEGDQPPASMGRGNMLEIATKKSLEMLPNPKGFFLMVEGSQIDWGGHDNNLKYMTEEMLDFDQVVGQVLEFAARDGETLVIITADHETGGFALVKGDPEQGMVTGTYSTGSHTPVMVPVYAFGPQSELFNGIYENNTIYDKMMEAFGF